MASIIIIKCDSFKELLEIATAIYYQDIPRDTTIQLAVCKDIEEVLNGIIKGKPLDSLTAYINDIALEEAYAKLFLDISEYGLTKTSIKLIDLTGSIAITLEKQP